MAVTLQQVRDQYPEYDDMSDTELADALYGAFYSDMDQAEFYSLVGLSEEEEEEEDAGWWEGRAAGAAASLAYEPAAAIADVTERSVVPGMAELGAAGAIGRDLPGAPSPYVDPEKIKEAPDADILGTLPETWRTAGHEARKTQAASMPDNAVLSFLTEAVDAGVVMAPAVLTTMATGGANLGLAVMSLPAFGAGYEDGLKRFNGDADKALMEGMITTAKEIGSEKLFGVFDRIGVSASFKKAFFDLMAREAGSEGFTEAVDQIDKAFRFGEFQEDWKKAGGAILHAAGLGAVLGGAIAGPSTYAASQNAAAEEPLPEDVPPPAGPEPLDLRQEQHAATDAARYAADPVQQELGFPEREPEQGDLFPPYAPEFEPVEREDYRSEYEEFGSEKVWQRAYEAADALPQDAQEVWVDFSQQLDALRAQEDAMFDDWRAEKDARAEKFEPAVRLPDETYTGAELELWEQEATRQSMLGFDNLDQINNAETIVQEIEQERTPEAEEWAVLFRPENVPYVRGSDSGGWRVTAFQPETGRVFAEYETDNGKVSYTWKVDEDTAPQPHPIYTDPETGEATYQLKYSPAFSKKVLSKAFKKQVDRMARAGMKYGTPDVTFEQIEAARKSRAGIFTGAMPLEQVLREETRRIPSLGSSELVPGSSSVVVGENQSGRTPVSVERKSPEQLRKEIEEEVRGRQKSVLSVVESRMEKPTSWRPFRLDADTTAKIETRIEGAALGRVKRGTTLQERAYQVLPNGDIRVLNIQPNETLDGYDVVVVSVGGKRVADRPVVHTIPATIKPTPRKMLDEMRGDTVDEKLENARQDRRRVEYESERKAREADRLSKKGQAETKGTSKSAPSTSDGRRRTYTEASEQFKKRIKAVSERFGVTEEMAVLMLEEAGEVNPSEQEGARLQEDLLRKTSKIKQGPSAEETRQKHSTAAKKGRLHTQLIRMIEPYFESTVAGSHMGRVKLGREPLSLHVTKDGKVQRNVSGDTPVEWTARGQRQRRHAEKLMSALIEAGMGVDELADVAGAYSDWLIDTNPELREVFNISGKTIRDSYQSKDPRMATKSDPLAARKLRVKGRNLEKTDPKYAERARNYRISQLARETGVSKEVAEAILDGIETSNPTDIAAAGKVAQERPIEGRRISVDPIDELAETTEVRSGTRLTETTRRIQTETEKQLKEREKELAQARKLEAELRGEVAKVGKLSKSSIDRLRRLEEANKKSRSQDRKAQAEARAEQKKVLDEVRADNKQLREEMKALAKQDAARSREASAARAAAKSNAIRQEAASSKADEELANLERVDSTEQVAQDVLFQESIQDKIDAIKKRHAKTRKAPAAKAEQELQQKALVQLELDLPEPVRQTVLDLQNDEQWRKDGDNTPPPNTPLVPENKEVLDLETSDPVEQAVYVEAVLEESQRYPRLWRYLNVFTRYAGLSKPSRKVVDAEVRLRGAITHAVSLSRRQWALARPHLKKAGWKRNDRTWDRALNAYLEGSAPQFIEEEYGIAIPEEAQVHLDKWKEIRRVLAQSGVGNGAWGRESTRGSIIGGRAYLHKLAKQTKATEEQIKERLPQLAALAQIAWDLPQTVEDVRKMTRGQLLSLLNNQKHGIWNSHIKPARAEEEGSLHARNALMFEYNGARMELGQGEGNRVTARGLNKAFAGLKDEALAAAKAEQLRQLQDIVIAGLPTKAAYERAVNSMVKVYNSETQSALMRGRGANKSIQQQRRLMLSHAERIQEAAPRIRASLPSDQKPVFDAFYKSLGDVKKMTLGTFLKRVKAEFPRNTKGILQVEAEAKLANALRDAINEVTDTETLMGRTMEGISATVYTSQYLQLVSAVGFAYGFASNSQAARPGWVPLSEPGTALGDATFHIPGNNTFSKGSDIFVPAQVQGAIADLFGTDAGMQVGKGEKLFRNTSGLVKYGKVVLVPLAHLRNLFSTRMIHYANNAVGYGAVRARMQAAKLMGGQFASTFGATAESSIEKSKSKATQVLQEWMEKRGMLYDGGKAGAIYDLFRNSIGAANLQTQKKHKAMELGRRAKHAVDEWFRLEDESVKATGFLMAAAEILELQGHDQSLLDRGLAGEEMSYEDKSLLNATLDKAAELTLNLYPTFSRTSPFIKWLSRMPFFGAFPSFAFEVARTSINGLLYTADLAQASVTGKMLDGTKVSRHKAAALAGAKAGQRIAMHSVGVVAAQTISAMAYANLFKEDDDDEDTAWHEYLPDWFEFATNGFRVGETPEQRQSQGLLQWWQRDTMAVISQVNPETHDYRTVQVDYGLPTGAWDAALMKGYQDIQRAMETGDTNIVKATANAVKMQLHNIFLNEEVLVGAILDRVGGPGDTYSHDRALTKAADWLQLKGMDLFDGKSDVMNNIVAPAAAAALEHAPGTEAVAQMFQLWEWVADKADKENDPEVAQLADSVVSILGHVSGLKQRDVSFKEDWTRNFKADMRDLGREDQIMREALSTGDFEDYEEFKAAFDVHNTYRRQKFDILFNSLSGARQKLGASRGEIRRALHDAHADKEKSGLTLGMMEAGRYFPPKPKTFIKTLIEWDEATGANKAKEKAISREEIVQRRKWYIQAYREAGYELSDYE